ncbi:MAG: response regulator [Polyangiaceae bacterium]|nr:response regulator [Polyangiaceae bacterium]
MSSEKHVLLVEDNPDDEALTLRALKKAHIANPVIVLRDGAEAVEFVTCRGRYANRDPTDTPQVILLDLNLPFLSGFDVLKAIRAERHTRLLPVVVLTSSKEEEDLVASYSLGANSYVRKPVDFAEFADAVRKLGLFWLVVNEAPPPARGALE